MIVRYVYRCRCNASGQVVALASRAAEWSPRPVEQVIDDLDSDRYRYLIRWETGDAEVAIVDDPFAPGRRTIDAATSDGRPGGLALLPHA